VKDTLRKLVTIYGPSGREAAVAEEITALLRPYVDEIHTDALGNVIATLDGKSTAPAPDGGAAEGPRPGFRVMLCAHMDQSGLIVTEVTPEGLLRFSVVGRLRATSLPGQRVRGLSGTPGLVRLDDGVEVRDIASGKMHIEVGASDRDAAMAKARPGDVFLPTASLLDFGDCQSSPALDNRAGCAVLVEVARGLKSAASHPSITHFVFSVQGAVDPRGAHPAAYGLRPDLGLVVDVARAKTGGSKIDLTLGQGPAIRIRGDNYIAPPRVRDLLERAAIEANLRYQFEVTAAEETASDASAIEIAGAGTLTGVLTLPARGCWTTSATVSLADLEATATLLLTILKAPITL